MAISQNPNVYMETMEETENEGEEPAENGSAERIGMEGREQPKRLLVYHTNGSGKYGNDKRKTCLLYTSGCFAKPDWGIKGPDWPGLGLSSATAR